MKENTLKWSHVRISFKRKRFLISREKKKKVKEREKRNHKKGKKKRMKHITSNNARI